MEDKHKLSADLVRVISATAIVIIHTVSGSYFQLNEIGYKNWLITAFIGWLMMWGSPVFIMISGYLLIASSKTNNFNEFISRRASRILIPLIFWNIFYYLFKNNFSTISISGFLNELLHSGTYSHLYFLNLMVGLYLITPFLSGIITKINLRLIVPILITISSLYHFSYCFLGFPKLDSIFVLFLPYIGYYLAGYWVGHMSSIKHLKIKSFFIFAIFITSIFLTRKLVFIFDTNDQDTILVSRLSLPVAFVATIVFYYLISLTNKTLAKLTFLSKISNLTLGVYLIHPFWLGLFKEFPYYQYLYTNHYWIWFISRFTLAVFLSFTTTYLLKKTRFLNRIV